MKRGVVRALLFASALLMAALSPLPCLAQFGLVYSFTAVSGGKNTDGALPKAALIQGLDLDLYGTASAGGANGTGALFKVTTGGVLTPLHSFSALTNSTNGDGATPVAGLLQTSDGTLWGTAEYGGSNGVGTAYMFSGSTLTPLHSFSNNMSDGGRPTAPLMLGSDGNLYGACSKYGNGGGGTVFKLTTAGALTHIYSFGTTIGGSYPYAPVVEVSGDLYGMTEGGGANGYGEIYQLNTSDQLSDLHDFGGNDGSFPNGGLILAKDGNLYGAAFNGGSTGGGTLFSMSTGGSFKLLHTFIGTDGSHPNSLIQATDGNFYGTTYGGGAHSDGTVFKMDSTGAVTTLYSFSGSDGQYPMAGLVQASDGNLYGATYQGGANGDGAIFRWTLSTAAPALTSISPGSADAGGPAFTLKLKGTGFASGAVAGWKNGTNTTQLATTFVSSEALTAAVPASLIANHGSALVTVADPGSAASNAKKFNILVTTVNTLSASLTRDSSSGVITAAVTLKNIGYNTAPAVTVTRSTLNKVATGSTLPLAVGDIAAGATAPVTLTFPGSAGTTGEKVKLLVAGKFTGGVFSGTLTVTLP